MAGGLIECRGPAEMERLGRLSILCQQDELGSAEDSIHSIDDRCPVTS
jgi:hypothetical protein